MSGNDGDIASSSSPPKVLRRQRFAKVASMVAAQLSKQQGKTSNFARNRFSSQSDLEGPSLIIPRLYLGDYWHALDEKTLRKLGVTHVVSVLEFCPSYSRSYAHTGSQSQSNSSHADPSATKGTDSKGHRKKEAMKVLHIPIRDTFTTDILKHLDNTTAFIADALKDPDSVVLVHCFQGISRSPTVVAAYLLASSPSRRPSRFSSSSPSRSHRDSDGEAYDFTSAFSVLEFLKQKRNVVNPNFSFVVQLEEYAKLCIERRRASVRRRFSPSSSKSQSRSLSSRLSLSRLVSQSLSLSSSTSTSKEVRAEEGTTTGSWKRRTITDSSSNLLLRR